MEISNNSNKKDIIDEEIKAFENKGGYVIINMRKDNMRLSYRPDCNKDECLFCTNPKKWTKKDICEVIKAFHITIIELPTRGFISDIDILNPRNLEYHEALKQAYSLYTKKLIFLIRKTLRTGFLNVLRKQRFIALVKADSSKNISLELFKDIDPKDNSTFVPIFSDSDMLRAYLNEKEKDKNFNIKGYSPLIMKFRDVSSTNKKDANCNVIINPISYPIQGKDFTFKITPDLMEYIYKVIEPKFQEYKKQPREGGK